MNDKNKSLFENKIIRLISDDQQRKHKDLDNIYTQVESLLWLQKRIKLNYPLPPLRGWPVSPDLLLKLNLWIKDNSPKVVVETGSGASTLVIADALRQNGIGKLYSLEHMSKYAKETEMMLRNECLSSWVDVLLSDLGPWKGDHLIKNTSSKLPLWYSIDVSFIENIDLLIVDGPPKSTCKHARFPALPAFFCHLKETSEVWMDDTIRDEEREICEAWSTRYGFKLEFYSLEKGLGILKR